MIGPIAAWPFGSRTSRVCTDFAAKASGLNDMSLYSATTLRYVHVPDLYIDNAGSPKSPDGLVDISMRLLLRIQRGLRTS